MKIVPVFAFVSVFASVSVCCVQATEKVNWLRSWAEYLQTDSALRAQKPVFIDLYTDWCGWCKVMDKKTFSNDSVAQYINAHYIPLKLNAETKERIRFRGVDFVFDDQLLMNRFAIYLTKGRLGFPTVIVLYPNGQYDAIPGYQRVQDIEKVLKFHAQTKGKQKFEDFMKDFVDMW